MMMRKSFKPMEKTLTGVPSVRLLTGPQEADDPRSVELGEVITQDRQR